MEKLYNRTYWKNAPDNTTPLNAENLDNIEAGIDGLDDRVVELKSDLSEEVTKRNEAISDAVNTEKERAILRENEIEALFTAPTEEAVSKWLDEHPEATTTVQDNSLTIDKMVVGALGYVTPEMFGYVEGEDCSVIIEQMCNQYDTISFNNKTYNFKTPLKLRNNITLIGASKQGTVLYFEDGIDGVQLNHSVCIKNLTISCDGKCILNKTNENTAYNLASVCENIKLIGRSDEAIGMYLYSKKDGVNPYGSYNLTFENIEMRGSFNNAIEFFNDVTTNEQECWTNDVKFMNIFIDKANTVLKSSWNTDVIPLTELASRNERIYLNNVNAQYVSGYTKNIVTGHNLWEFTLDNCRFFDYYHLIYDDVLPYYVFNGKENMCRINLGEQSEINIASTAPLSRYISFINTDNFDVTFYKTVYSLIAQPNRTLFATVKNGNNNVGYLKQIITNNLDTIWDDYSYMAEGGVLEYSARNGLELVIGFETEGGGGVQFYMCTSLATSPVPVLKSRLKYGNKWLRWCNVSVIDGGA